MNRKYSLSQIVSVCRKLKTKELVFFYFAILLVQTINFFLFGDIRFSSGIPSEHWGILFIRKFPIWFWFFLRNGWIFYILFFIFFWLKVKSLKTCIIGFFPIIILVAIFDFCFISHNPGMSFRFDAIGLVISIVFIAIISISYSVFLNLLARLVK